MSSIGRADAVAPSMVTIVSMDSTEIAAWRSGSGPPLVLVHGGTTDHTAWNPVVPELERHFTVYAVDRRGRGGSGDAPTYAVEREFEDVAAVVDSLEGSVHLVGHSYGALCALEAARLTSNIAKLVLYEPPLVDGSSGVPPGFIDELDALLALGKRDELTARVFTGGVGSFPRIHRRVTRRPVMDRAPRSSTHLTQRVADRGSTDSSRSDSQRCARRRCSSRAKSALRS
jgi:pimeloyl-ACP methyl ester carboxylesterase